MALLTFQASLRWKFVASGTRNLVPIAVKESLALLRTLESLADNLQNSRIDAFVDNKVLLSSWENQMSRSSVISDVLKSLFEFSYSRNLCLSLVYVPSKDSPADTLSRALSDLDCSLSSAAWKRIDTAFGQHTLDLMTIPCNVMSDRSGRPLRFFSPFPCAQAVGTNVFAQVFPPSENAYVFPPFVLIGPLFTLLSSQGCSFSIVVPDLRPRKFWWPIVERSASRAFKLGSKGDSAILLFPVKSGPSA